jgi:hypothetical protein
MEDQVDTDLFIASLTVAEIWRGILEKPAGKKRDQLETWFAGPDGPRALFAGRVLSFDEKAGLIWAHLMAEGTARGRPRSALDMIVAAIAEAHDCVVVTENEKDFAGREIINPLAERSDGMTTIRAVGDLPLSRRRPNWQGFFAALREADIPADFLGRSERDQGGQDRDPFTGWHE